MSKINQRLQTQVQHAYSNASATRQRFEAANLQPDDIQSVADLEKLPALPKDELIAMQQADPPFGGLLAIPLTEVAHIFFSPGPIYEPDTGDGEWESTVHAPMQAIGFAAGDIVLNTLSYHLVPAGLLLDSALTSMGCTVVPGGVGNSDLQLKMMLDLGITGYVGTPSFLMSLIQKAEEQGLDFNQAFKLKKALVTAEPLPPALRETLTETYGIALGNAYGTAELGFLALNTGAGMAMQLLAEPIIEVIDPDTGKSVGNNEAGEVVVTNFSRAYPLIRLGTGDMAILTDPNPGSSKQEERAITLVGRSGEAVKVRGMFVHPNQLRFVASKVTSFSAIQGVVTRPENRDHFVVRIVAEDKTTGPALQEAIQSLCRVRVDTVDFVDTIEESAPGMVDARSWD